MRQGRYVRVVGISVLLSASGLGVAEVVPRALRGFVSSTISISMVSSPFASGARVGGARGAGWQERRSPSFESVCGAVVTAPMGQTFACHKRIYDLYYARSGAAPTGDGASAKGV